jgi:putative oxidoreductase
MNDSAGKLLLRVVLGVLILLHGVAKVRSGIGGISGMVTSMGLPAVLAYGVYIGEVVAPLMLIIGWYSRVAAAVIAVNMVFAIALAHQSQLLDLSNTGGWALELQGMYLFTAIALMMLGPGRHSVNER